jgi:cholesterol oxidase
MTGPPNPVDAVVVGSGFGGSIAACRLAQAGRSVVVLERGRRYRPEDFPRDVTDVDALLWRHERRRRATGLYDVRFFSALGAVVAAGVGGGSLVYANIHIRPDAIVFDDPGWPEGTDRASLDPYYDRVAAMLQVAPVPAWVSLPKRDVFHAAAAGMGREVFDPDEAVHWPQDASDQRQGACRFVAECEFGCRVGAKRTLDKTYLAEAQRRGARVRPGRVVVALRPVAAGFEVLHRDVATGENEVTVGRRVVLAAGTLGTGELLLASRDRDRSLPRLSPMLGRGFSANGDFLGSIQDADHDVAPDLGPDVTSVMRFFDQAPEFTLAAPTFNAPVMKVLASMGQPSARLPRPVASLAWRTLPRVLPWLFARGLLSRPSPLPAPHTADWRRSTSLFAIGRDNAGGRLHLTRRGLDVSWDYRRENAALLDRMQHAMAQVAQCYGGAYAPLATWNAFRRIITVHPLGGCALSTGSSTGVVSPCGEVYGYPGLFVADGSVVPTAIGFHPAMTISALAERTADAVVASY